MNPNPKSVQNPYILPLWTRTTGPQQNKEGEKVGEEKGKENTKKRTYCIMSQTTQLDSYGARYTPLPHL